MPSITPKGAAMSEKSRHDSALINISPRICQPPKSWKNGKNRPKNLGKTAKTSKITLEKRQKQIIFAKKADSAWHYSDT